MRIRITDLLFAVAILIVATLLGIKADAQQQLVYVDPCQTPSVSKSSKVVSLASTTATAIVAAVAGQIVYVCSVVYTLAGTSPTSLWTSAATCGTSPTNLTGTFAPTTGSVISIGGAGHVAVQNVSGQNLCLTLAGTSPSAQGLITYVQR